ncbi:MAG TPA: LPS-assembly protein LptD [Rhodospirillaceae bacterium]|nr:LPS-assembly protein LptD [Rhodospirillaceae bacterium]
MGRLFSAVLGIICLLVAGPIYPRGAQAAGLPEADIPIKFSADKLSYDSELGIVTASGGVEAVQENRVLRADTITYSQQTDLLTATGNITLLEPSGDVLFAEYMELSGDMKDGIIEDLRLVLSDSSRIAAAGGRRSGGVKLDLRKAVYSPCNLCPDEPDRPPLWQVKAAKVVHDKDRKVIQYSHARLEVAGIPVAYTPYFSHADPTVKRESGFIVPDMGNSSELGFFVTAPYFFNIAPNQDATLTPMFTAKEGPVLAGEYRHFFLNGKLEASGSVTHDSDGDLRGHIFSEGRFDIDDTWRWGFDVNRAKDDTYLRRYRFGSNSDDTLTTHLFAEGFRKRNYFSVNAYAYQGLQESDDSGTSPYVFPMLDYSHVGEADRFGGRTNLDVSLLALTRTEGPDTRRLSVKGGWQLPFLGPLGDTYTLSASLQGDVYHVNSLVGGENEFNGISGRMRPEVALDWRFPIIKEADPIYHVVEPIAAIIVSPYGGNSENIPNEDSLDFEFDDTNLFSSNRFTGFDKVESGPRVNYGLKWGVFGRQGGSTTILVGQSLRLKDDSTFARYSGLEDNFSDIVGKVHIAPSSFLDLLYRTRIDKDDLDFRRNEVRLSAGVPAFNISSDYVFFDRQEKSEFRGREEISMHLNSRFNRFWRGQIGGVRDLDDDGGMRSLSLNLTYENECLVVSTTATRHFFEDRDLDPTDAVIFRVSLKTLGDVKAGL